MLQGTADSSTLIAETKRYVRRQVELALAICEKLTDTLENVGGSTVVYAGYAGYSYARAAAITYYRALRQLAQLNANIEAVEALTYHVLAYREEGSIILLFAEPGTENMLGRIADAARYTGAKLTIVSPPLPPILKVWINENHLVEVNEEDPTLAYMIASLRLAARTASKASGVKLRIDRLKSEMEDLDSIVEDLILKYRGELEQLARIREGANIAITFTPTMEPPAIILGRVLQEKGFASLMPISSMLSYLATKSKPWDYVVVLSTDVEADSVRELQFKLSMTSKPPSIVRINLRTDPLTAPVYATILAKHAEKILGGGR